MWVFVPIFENSPTHCLKRLGLKLVIAASCQISIIAIGEERGENVRLSHPLLKLSVRGSVVNFTRLTRRIKESHHSGDDW